jgi:hypothetical protein
MYQYDEARGVFEMLAPSDEARRVMSFAGAWAEGKPLKMSASDVDGIIKLAAARMLAPASLPPRPVTFRSPMRQCGVFLTASYALTGGVTHGCPASVRCSRV